MSRIAFFCIPAHGHTNPTLGVVKELISRGHEVFYFSYDEFKEKIESTGAEFFSCDAYDIQTKLSEKDKERIGSDLVFSTRLLVDVTLSFDEILMQKMNEIQPDCIVADSMAIWGKAIAYKLHIPFISSNTTFVFNQNVAKMMSQGFSDMMSGIKAFLQTKKDIKRIKDKGYPFNNVLDIIENKPDTPTIVYTSPYFQPYADQFSNSYSFVGPILRPVQTEFKKTKDKLIYISLGTVMNNRPEFYRQCIEAFKDTEYQVVISTGKPLDLEVPENIQLYAHVDQMAVLEKADVFFSHCGMNSANEALYHCVPLVCYPQTKEQSLVALRTEQLHAGIRLENIESATILQATQKILADASYRENAKKIAQSFEACGHESLAANKIEDIIHSFK